MAPGRSRFWWPGACVRPGRPDRGARRRSSPGHAPGPGRRREARPVEPRCRQAARRARTRPAPRGPPTRPAQGAGHVGGHLALQLCHVGGKLTPRVGAHRHLLRISISQLNERHHRGPTGTAAHRPRTSANSCSSVPSLVTSSRCHHSYCCNARCVTHPSSPRSAATVSGSTSDRFEFIEARRSRHACALVRNTADRHEPHLTVRRRRDNLCVSLPPQD